MEIPIGSFQEDCTSWKTACTTLQLAFIGVGVNTTLRCLSYAISTAQNPDLAVESVAQSLLIKVKICVC